MTGLFSVERMFPRLRARDKRDVLRKLASVSVHDAELPETVILDAVTRATDDLPLNFHPAAVRVSAEVTPAGAV